MFKCDYCAKEFTDKQSRHKHTYYIHITEKKYVCKYCNHKEYSKAILKQHMSCCEEALKNGYEPKIYECDVCFKIFKQNGNLQSHREKEHNIKRPHTRISRNKLRGELFNERYNIKEIDNIKTPKRFYIIDNLSNNNMEDTGVILHEGTDRRIVIINSVYFCKANANIWCDNMNIIDGFYNFNWDKLPGDNNDEKDIYNKIKNVWSSFRDAIISLAVDRPKQEPCITEILKKLYTAI